MAIFNSLGSNYDFKYVLKALLTKGSKLDIERLKKLLEEKYRGKALLFYKGREALTATLKILNLPQNSNVAINGFTCVAVFNAIRTAGLEPICLDLEETGGLNFTAKTLEQSIKKNKKIKVVIVKYVRVSLRNRGNKKNLRKKQFDINRGLSSLCRDKI